MKKPRAIAHSVVQPEYKENEFKIIEGLYNAQDFEGVLDLLEDYLRRVPPASPSYVLAMFLYTHTQTRMFLRGPLPKGRGT